MLPSLSRRHPMSSNKDKKASTSAVSFDFKLNVFPQSGVSESNLDNKIQLTISEFPFCSNNGYFFCNLEISSSEKAAFFVSGALKYAYIPKRLTFFKNFFFFFLLK